MKKLIENFPGQLRQALDIATSARLSSHSHQIQNVVITGLGGSGIGGTIAQQLIEKNAPVPVLVNKKYHIPGFVGENTLVIVSSYSGNTEETLSALEDALVRKAKVVCITSGGRVADLARVHGLDLILIPPGMPPRACLGYSLIQLLHILTWFDISGESYATQIHHSIELLRNETSAIKTEAKLLAEKLKGKIPVIYSSDVYEGVAIRFRQQINENAKMLAWHHVFPELNHNELVGWRRKYDELAIILIRNESDFDRNIRRMEISSNIIKGYCDNISEVTSKGETELERTIYLIHMLDWTSVYLAEINEVDPVEVKVIDHLKSELATR